MKKSFLWICCLLLSAQLFAQTDSAALISGQWANKKLAPQVFWKTLHLMQHQLFGANQNINILA